VVESERKAREVAMHRQAKSRDVKLAQKSANMQDVFSTMGETKPNLVQLLVKADVQGSVEALRDALKACPPARWPSTWSPPASAVSPSPT
jgi:translation initiation factor IF-2